MDWPLMNQQEAILALRKAYRYEVGDHTVRPLTWTSLTAPIPALVCDYANNEGNYLLNVWSGENVGLHWQIPKQNRETIKWVSVC